jgi:excinuclease ABC subunit A
MSIAEGVVKPFQTGQMRQCQEDLLTRAIQREVDIHCPFEELPLADQNWVIEGDVRPDLSADEVWESGGWYGVRGFFNWMESRTYKMHVRVFLSRYRAYTLCPECQGTRFKPETLNFKVVIDGKRHTLSALQQMPVDALSDRLGRLNISQKDGTTAQLPGRRRPGVLDIGSPDPIPFGWRNAAGQSHHLPWRLSG